MPELPEVETVAGDLRQALVGRRLVEVEARQPKIVRYPSPRSFCRRLAGRRIEAVSRRGKFIVMQLDAPEVLVAHLGMTGHLRVVTPGDPLVPHTHVRAALDDGTELRYDDARRFGRLVLGAEAELLAVGALPQIGIDPLGEEFTDAAVDAWLRHSRRSLKAALLDQRHVAGLGNIYADEACYHAGVRPTRRCHTLTRAQRAALHTAIVEVLTQAVRNRGSTIDDYRDLWNARGTHQEQLQVYGRGGEPCFGCGGTLRRLVVAQRTTVYCPRCQH